MGCGIKSVYEAEQVKKSLPFTEEQFKKIILDSTLDVPSFMGIADFDHQIRVVYNRILNTIKENVENEKK